MKKYLFVILFLFVAFSFLTLPRNALQTDDASGYALTVRNTILYQQWLAPMLTLGDPTGLVDKPPLGIWLLAWAPKVFGINELTVHIPNVVYFAVILLIMYFSLARLASQETALYSTLIAATSLCLVVYSRAPKLDVPLTLCLLTAHLLLFAYLKSERPGYAYGVAAAAAAGFLVKSGLGVLPLALTVLAGAAVLPEVREKLVRFLFSRHALFCLIIFLTLTGGVIGAQSLIMKDQWLPYLQSITIKSPYNPGYLGLGFYPSIIGLLLITIFPWTPLFLTGLKVPRTFSLGTFCALWFWPNFLFLLFCYKFTDFRTFTSFVPPMAILAGIKLIEIFKNPARKPRSLFAGFRARLFWSVFFLFIFTAILIALLINPVNAEGINLSAAVIPVALFVVSLALFAFFCLKPSSPSLAICFALVALSYSVLFYNTRPIADAFNPDIKWPALISEYRQNGAQFYIYRPRDRARFMSPDLFYVDFMAGPADRYYWDGEQLKRDLLKEKALVLSDTASWQKLGLTRGKTIAEDNYSRLIAN
jgi:4-amino-4-deoxy-L-arabinose transferase-like glycosyltransferase